MSRPGQSGSGPGPITPDGSAVELYTLLKPGKDPALVHEAVPSSATILELGCGAGRMTHALADLGHEIVAVDESADMLRHVRDESSGVRIRKVCSTIEKLHLGEDFDVVLLASHLVNMGGSTLRRQLLDTCRRHVRRDGCLIIQQHDPAFLAAPIVRERGDTRFAVRDIERVDEGIVTATLEYQISGSVWTQTITVHDLDDRALERCLREASLRLDTYLTPDHTWLRALPEDQT